MEKPSAIELTGVEVQSIISNQKLRMNEIGEAHKNLELGDIEILRKIGKFDLELYWFNRRIVGSIEELTIKTS